MQQTNDFLPVTETGARGLDHLTILAARLVEHRARRDALDAELTDCKAQIDLIEEEMASTMLAGEYGKFTVAGKTFFLSQRRHVSSVPEYRDELIAWLDAAGHAEMAKRTVHPATLGKFVRELLDESGQLPTDLEPLVNVYETPTISVRKG